MTIKASEISEGATVYVAHGPDGLFSSETASEEKQLTSAGGPINIYYPDKVYITVVASSEGEDSAFNLQAKFILDMGTGDVDKIIKVIDTEIIEEEEKVIKVDLTNSSNTN